MIVLDSNVVSELMRPSPSPVVLSWVDFQLRDELHVTSVSVAEILVGIERLPNGRRKDGLARAFVEILSARFPGQVLDFDYPAAIKYASLAVRRERIGRRTEVPDAQIAAICLAHGAALATRNGKDFEETGVKLINPWDQ